MSAESAERTGLKQSEGPTVLELARMDLEETWDSGLLWLVVLALSGATGIAGVALTGLSWALFTTGDLPGYVTLVTASAAWLFTSLFAIVGLFCAYPRIDSSTAPEHITGLLVGRWLLVGIGVLPGLAIVGLVGALTYDPFSLPVYLGFVVLTVLVLAAYVSIGVTIRLVTDSGERAIAGLLGTYVGLVFLWDTTIVPLLLAAPVVGADAVGNPPGWLDGIIALSPGRAYAATAEGLLEGIGLVEGFAALVLCSWIVLPPLVATWVR